MANRKGHLKVHAFMVLPIFFILLRATKLPLIEIAAILCGYLVAEKLLSPDLDLYHSRASEHWGYLKPIWKPYAYFFKHRGLSHHLIWGAVSRITYLIVLFALLSLVSVQISYLAGFETKQDQETLDFSALPVRFFLWVSVGIGLGNMVHIILDRTLSQIKRLRRKYL